MHKTLVVLTGLFCFLLWTSAASAYTMQVIGTATYEDAPNASNNNSLSDTANVYNLIYDADSPFGPITWLDYGNGKLNWYDQTAWAAGLDSDLSINLNPGVSVNWSNSSWRLPSTVDGVKVWGYDGTTTAGFNIDGS